MRKKLAFLLLSTLFAPALCGAATQSSKDYDDQGLALFNKGLYSKSIEYFQDAVQADSTNWQAYEDLGNAYSQTKQTNLAIDAYQRSLQGNPNNPTVKEAITNLGGNPNTAPSGPAPQANNQPAYNQGQPSETVVVERRHRRAVEEPTTYADGLPALDHAKFWTRAEIGYSNSQLGELSDGAANINNKTYVQADPNMSPTYDGSASVNQNAFNLGAEFGFLLNENNGLAIGIRYLTYGDYTADVTYSAYGDSEDATFSPYLVPITLDYYLFLPDKGGRFFFTVGAGYYFSDVRINENYTFSNFYNQEGTATLNGGGTPSARHWDGDLYSGNIGFQIGLGREFALNNHFGLELFARGRYCRITNYRGTVTDANSGNSATVALATGTTNGTVDFDAPANITAANEEKFTTLDFTDFDLGVGLTFF